MFPKGHEKPHNSQSALRVKEKKELSLLSLSFSLVTFCWSRFSISRNTYNMFDFQACCGGARTGKKKKAADDDDDDADGDDENDCKKKKRMPELTIYGLEKIEESNEEEEESDEEDELEEEKKDDSAKESEEGEDEDDDKSTPGLRLSPKILVEKKKRAVV